MSEPRYTRDKVSTIANAVADELAEHTSAEGQDLCNVFTNVLLTWLDDDTLSLEEAIERNWQSETFEDVLGWLP
jgi:hypothetical protein